MFLVKNLTTKRQEVSKVYETKDVLDIITGIIGDNELTDISEALRRMTFGDVFTRHSYFKVQCVRDEAHSLHQEIEEAATQLLKRCTDDYALRIWSIIASDVIDDVELCTGDEDGFTDGDIALAIGRAIAERFGFEV